MNGQEEPSFTDESPTFKPLHSLPVCLTDEQKAAISADKVTLSDFKQQLLERDAQKSWDLFYKRNTTCFYKDRHWTSREFPELNSVSSLSCHRTKKAVP